MSRQAPDRLVTIPLPSWSKCVQVQMTEGLIDRGLSGLNPYVDLIPDLSIRLDIKHQGDVNNHQYNNHKSYVPALA